MMPAQYSCPNGMVCSNVEGTYDCVCPSGTILNNRTECVCKLLVVITVKPFSVYIYVYVCIYVCMYVCLYVRSCVLNDHIQIHEINGPYLRGAPKYMHIWC